MKHRGKWARAGLAALSALALGAVAEVASAEGRANGTRIVSIAMNGTVAWIATSTDIGGTPPSCTTNRREFVFDPTTTWGKLYLPLLQAAYLSGRRVDLSGAGTCANIGSVATERLLYVKVYD